VQRGKLVGNAQRGNKLDFGDFGLQVLVTGFITNKQIEAARVAITRQMKRRGQMWIRIFPDKPYTKKPLETRMGKGKGEVEYWVAPVQAGRILFEVSGCPESIARAAFARGASKIPLTTRMLSRTAM
jgi:large subunit ribosomal protein L16